MIKVVYFDEGSATDFIYVLAGGKSSDKKEHIVTKTTEIAAGAEAEASKSASIFSMLTAKVGIDGFVPSGEFSTMIRQEKDKIIAFILHHSKVE